jgi:abelson tyrosine-protein kinase 1
MRPSLPPSYLTSGPLMDVIRSSWDYLPSNRPSFEQIARDIKKLRTERSAPGPIPSFDSPKPVPILAQWEAQGPYHPHHSPDILPQPIPDGTPPARSQDSITLLNGLNDAEGSHPGSALGLDIGNNEAGYLPVEKGRTDPWGTVNTRSSSTSSETVPSEANLPDQTVLASGYLSPFDHDDMAAKCQHERRYRMLLQHDFNTIRGSSLPCLVLPVYEPVVLTVTLPLWQPSHVELGSVGFLSKPDGRFETWFNAFNPGPTSAGKADELPMLSGYGKVLQGNHRHDKRNAAQRGFDRVQGLFSSTYVHL